MKIVTSSRVFDGYCFNPEIEAIAIDGGTIAAVGKKSELIDLIASPADIDDFGESILMPGIIDSHIHLLEYGHSLEVLSVETKTKQSCLEIVKKAAQQAKPDEWIFGHGWNQNIWLDGMPTLADLDFASPRNPVLLTHKSLHAVWVNSKALQITGINTSTCGPAGGSIGRDSEGNLDGVLYESAVQLLNNKIPVFSEDEISRKLSKAHNALLDKGITAVHDFDKWQILQTIQKLEKKQKWNIGVVKNIPHDTFNNIECHHDVFALQSPHIKTGWLKLFADGALGPHTAALFSPYKGTSNKGSLLLTEEEIVELGFQAARKGIALAVHAIGDHANHICLNAFEKISMYSQQNQLKPRVEHAQLVSDGDYKRFHKIGVIASMQPTHAITDQPTADRYWGSRCINAYAWQGMLNDKVTLIFGSDAPVEDPNPLIGIRAAISRKTVHCNNGWYPSQRITLEQALHAYTLAPAFVSKSNSEIGCIQPGRKANLVVYPLSAFNDDSQCTRPEAVMIDGKWLSRN